MENMGGSCGGEMAMGAHYERLLTPEQITRAWKSAKAGETEFEAVAKAQLALCEKETETEAYFRGKKDALVILEANVKQAVKAEREKFTTEKAEFGLSVHEAAWKQATKEERERILDKVEKQIRRII